MSYVMSAVLAVPTANKDAFLKHARIAAALFKEAGALRVMECWGDDVPDGEVTSYPKAVQCAEDETVVFSMIVWPSKEICEAAMEKIMSDDRMSHESNPMPFDGKRLIYGGFVPILEA